MTYVFRNLRADDVFDGTSGSIVAPSFPYLRDTQQLRFTVVDSNGQRIPEPQEGALVTLSGRGDEVVVKQITGVRLLHTGTVYALDVAGVASSNANTGGDIGVLSVSIFSGYCKVSDIEAVTGAVYTGTTSPAIGSVTRLITSGYNDVNSRAGALNFSTPFDIAISPSAYTKAGDLNVAYVVAHLQQNFDASAFASLLKEYRNKWQDIERGVDTFEDAVKTGEEPLTEGDVESDGLLQGQDALTTPASMWGVM